MDIENSIVIVRRKEGREYKKVKGRINDNGGRFYLGW